MKRAKAELAMFDGKVWEFLSHDENEALWDDETFACLSQAIYAMQLGWA